MPSNSNTNSSRKAKVLPQFSRYCGNQPLLDLLEIQRKSFFDLLKHGIAEELAKTSIFKETATNAGFTRELELVLNPETYKLVSPSCTPNEAILKGKTYASKLYVQATLTIRSAPTSDLSHPSKDTKNDSKVIDSVQTTSSNVERVVKGASLATGETHGSQHFARAKQMALPNSFKIGGNNLIWKKQNKSVDTWLSTPAGVSYLPCEAYPILTVPQTESPLRANPRTSRINRVCFARQSHLLHTTDPGRCTNIRFVRPLLRAAMPFRAGTTPDCVAGLASPNGVTKMLRMGKAAGRLPSRSRVALKHVQDFSALFERKRRCLRIDTSISASAVISTGRQAFSPLPPTVLTRGYQAEMVKRFPMPGLTDRSVFAPPAGLKMQFLTNRFGSTSDCLHSKHLLHAPNPFRNCWHLARFFRANSALLLGQPTRQAVPRSSLFPATTRQCLKGGGQIKSALLYPRVVSSKRYKPDTGISKRELLNGFDCSCKPTFVQVPTLASVGFLTCKASPSSSTHGLDRKDLGLHSSIWEPFSKQQTGTNQGLPTSFRFMSYASSFRNASIPKWTLSRLVSGGSREATLPGYQAPYQYSANVGSYEQPKVVSAGVARKASQWDTETLFPDTSNGRASTWVERWLRSTAKSPGTNKAPGSFRSAAAAISQDSFNLVPCEASSISDLRSITRLEFFTANHSKVEERGLIEYASRETKTTGRLLDVCVANNQDCKKQMALPCEASPFLASNLRRTGSAEQVLTASLKRGCYDPRLGHNDDVSNVQVFRPWIFLGELPLMTKRGHFILNGSPRVIVNQIARCPGIYFHEKRRGVGFEQEVRVSADLIPQRGPWLRIQSDWEGRFWARLKQEGRVKYATLYSAFQEYEKQYSAPLVSVVSNNSSFFPKSEIVSFQERRAKEERQKRALVRLFKNPTRYSLGKLGRARMNQRIHSNYFFQFLTTSSSPHFKTSIFKNCEASPGSVGPPALPHHTPMGDPLRRVKPACGSTPFQCNGIAPVFPITPTKARLALLYRAWTGSQRHELKGTSSPSKLRECKSPYAPLQVDQGKCVGVVFGGFPIKAETLRKYRGIKSMSQGSQGAAQFAHANVKQSKPVTSRWLCRAKHPPFSKTGADEQANPSRGVLPIWVSLTEIVARYSRNNRGRDKEGPQISSCWIDKTVAPLNEYCSLKRINDCNKRRGFVMLPFNRSRPNSSSELFLNGVAAYRQEGNVGGSFVKNTVGHFNDSNDRTGGNQQSWLLPPVSKPSESSEKAPNSLQLVDLLMAKDIDAVHNSLERLLEGQGFTDDIDHLKNRFVRTSGKLLQQQFELGLTRLNEVITPLLNQLLTSVNANKPLKPKQPMGITSFAGLRQKVVRKSASTLNNKKGLGKKTYHKLAKGPQARSADRAKHHGLKRGVDGDALTFKGRVFHEFQPFANLVGTGKNLKSPNNNEYPVNRVWGSTGLPQQNRATDSHPLLLEGLFALQIDPPIQESRALFSYRGFKPSTTSVFQLKALKNYTLLERSTVSNHSLKVTTSPMRPLCGTPTLCSSRSSEVFKGPLKWEKWRGSITTGPYGRGMFRGCRPSKLAAPSTQGLALAGTPYAQGGLSYGSNLPLTCESSSGCFLNNQKWLKASDTNSRRPFDYIFNGCFELFRSFFPSLQPTVIAVKKSKAQQRSRQWVQRACVSKTGPFLGVPKVAEAFERSFVDTIEECKSRRGFWLSKTSQNCYLNPHKITPLSMANGAVERGVWTRHREAVSSATGFQDPLKFESDLGHQDLLPLSAPFRWLRTSKPVNSALREFFGSNPLSQYMDQTNPLAEITHKRRLSSMGPGGIKRETAGMEVRGIHPTHYGRVCPIETPEGKNAGLVNSPTVYSRIGDNGFLETPLYQVIQNGVQLNRWTFLSAQQEEDEGTSLATCDTGLMRFNILPQMPIPVQTANNPLAHFQQVERNLVGYRALSPVQTISIATALIPFLEHDDANRALMGSNMQRQAIPLLLPERPIVGTGFEPIVISESGQGVQATELGYVSHVSANKIILYTPELLEGGRGAGNTVAPNVCSCLLLVDTQRKKQENNSKQHLSAATAVTCEADGFAVRSIPLENTGLRGRHREFNQLEGAVLCQPFSGLGLASAWARQRVTRLNMGRSILPIPCQADCFANPVDPFRIALAATKDTRLLSLANSCLDRCELPYNCNAVGYSRQFLTYKTYRLEFDTGTWIQKHPRIDPLSPTLAVQGLFERDLNNNSIDRTSYNVRRLYNLHSKQLGRLISLKECEPYVFLNNKLGGFFRALDDVVDGGQALPSRDERTSLEPSFGKKWEDASHVRAGDRIQGHPSQRPLKNRGLQCLHSKQSPSPNLCCTHTSSLLRQFEQPLQLYQRSNQETCLSQRPSVNEGSWIQKGDFLADCSASQFGDLALGKNVTVAYMPWEGYNFEDAIVISDRLVAEDVYTSIHIERYEIKVSKNSQGKERITNQIPGTSQLTKHLDQTGVARVSSWVQPGDILVGKVVELKRPLSPYERLAWELASRLSPTSPEREKWLNKVWLEDVSLRLPPGVCGRVINSQVVSTEWSEKEQTVHPLEVHIYLAVKRKVQVGDKLAGRHGNKGIVSTILPRQDMPYLSDGSPVDMVLNPLGVPSRMNLGQIFECLLGLAGSQLGCNFKCTPFDEIAGGEASRSLVFLKLYQCRLIYKQQWLFTPTFPGKSKLFDGRTGEPFDNWVTVGRAYMLKLIHMVDHKIHARSTGPYSLFTRQPVRGRSRRGGQRLGEMEVWAIEGFGAAYTLQEFLTIKSDDLQARAALQRSFYKQNDMTLEKVHISPGNPEAFKVLVSELKALCLHIQM